MQDKTLSEYWDEAKRIAERRWERGEPEFPTGLEFIDRKTDGIHRGEVWVVAGRPASGKTSLALQMAVECADNPMHSIMFLSLEMKGYELVTRMFCNMENIEHSQFRYKLLPQDYLEREKRFRDYLSKIDLSIYEFGYTFNEVEHIVNNAYKKKKPDIIFLDFIQLVEWKTFKEERLALKEYIRKLKELSKKLNIGVVVVSQLRRLPSGADYQRPPEIMDLLGSGSLEQTADVVVLVYYKKEGDDKQYFINLAKNRHGETGVTEVLFEGGKYRFREKIGGKGAK